VIAAAQYEVGALLEKAGAHPRGNRHDCPKCGGRRTVSHTEELFYCHKCQWRGNAVTLAKELGIYKRLPSAEYVRLQRERERAHEAARRLATTVHARRLDLLDSLRELNRLEARVQICTPKVWGALALVYRERPVILAELTILENASAADLVRFLTADAATREAALDRVLGAGGLREQRRMACPHCTHVRCRGTCLACVGTGAVDCEVLIEISA